MRGRRLCGVALVLVLGEAALLLSGSGCRKTPGPAAGATRAPKGDAVWFADPSAASEAGIEDALQRIGTVAVFLPAGEIALESGRWGLHADAPPTHPFGRLPAVLVLRARPDLAGAFAGEDGAAAKSMAASIATSLRSLLAAGGPYGRVVGLHLDFPISGVAAPGYAAFVQSLRAALPLGTFVSIAIGDPPADEASRKKLQPLLDAADALVAFTFRDGETVSPVMIDALRRPWWPAFGTAGHGVRSTPDGGPAEGVAERFLDPLVGSPRLDFSNDLSRNDAAIEAFHLAVREPVRFEGLALDAGDRVDFRLPVQTEMLYQLGSVLAGKHFALGRLIQFEGASDAERLLPLAAFEDVLLGRSLAPQPQVTVQPAGRNAVTVDLVNKSSHASVVSRLSNWVEVDLAPAHAADVQLGGFDRYEVYDGNGRPVTPGRASRVRLYETLLAPRETVSTARIVVRGALPKACCAYRLRTIAAAGPEVAQDWTSPPAPPPPTPRATRKR
ncbi:MAG TPA: hypothetical protein VGK26_07645 [Thermoanaerobaculia bacterium]